MSLTLELARCSLSLASQSASLSDIVLRISTGFDSSLLLKRGLISGILLPAMPRCSTLAPDLALVIQSTILGRRQEHKRNANSFPFLKIMDFFISRHIHSYLAQYGSSCFCHCDVDPRFKFEFADRWPQRSSFEKLGNQAPRTFGVGVGSSTQMKTR